MGSICAVSLALTALLTPVIGAGAGRWGLLDRPTTRSSHTTPVPRSGGLAILAALALCLALTGGVWRASAGTGHLLAGAAALALVGLLDDRFGLPALGRLLFQLAVATAVVANTGGLPRLPLPRPLDLEAGPWGSVLAVLWVVGVLNFYNFLDGIDGLAGLQGVITGLGLVAVSWHPLVLVSGAALAGACAGFLLFNWAPARIFMGDVGSVLLGFLFAALPLLAPAPRRGPAVFFVAMSLWLFLADAAFTLGRRVRRGAPWCAPHREHLYQQLVAAGYSHRVVALGIGLGSALLTAGAAAAWRRGAPWDGLTPVLAVSLLTAEYLALRRPEPRGAAA